MTKSVGSIRPPEMEATSIVLRAYAEQPNATRSVLPAKSRPQLGPSEWSLIFDTETTTCAAQQLRFGTYQVRKVEKLKESGVFYDADTLSRCETETLKAYCRDHRLQVRTTEEFLENVFLDVGYWLRATIVGFNLPFDISRIAIDHAPARKEMRGGFTFKLSTSTRQPRVQVKHLSSRASLIRFAKPGKQLTGRGSRRRNLRVDAHRGFFVDVKTLAAALTSSSHTLESITRLLQTQTRKSQSDEHGNALTEEYLSYAVKDTQATWEAYLALKHKYELHHLNMTPMHLIKSEAGIGKAYLKQMGIRPWRDVQPDFPPERLGQIMSAYYGGRSEVHIRRKTTQILYCDFLSMYPTVCTLMGLWQFVIAEGMTEIDKTDDVKARLEAVQLEDLQAPDAWKELAVLVQIKPDSDILPVRARYGIEQQNTIGLNYLSSNDPMWFTLADCIASKMLTGKSPLVLQAVGFRPMPHQSGLQAVQVGAATGRTVQPEKDDFYKTLIDHRSDVKARLKFCNDNEKAALEAEQLAIKILANSTSYGIFIEVNVEDSPEKIGISCYGSTGHAFQVQTNKLEKPGKYFHPLLAVLITGAARLMLAVTERLAKESALDWVFCDTDSMALARPDEMPVLDFYKKGEVVRRWFDRLNPYRRKGELLKLEEANYCTNDNRKLESLYCFAISAKRYALFNIEPNNQPAIRKASAHGLGHLMPPYDEDGKPCAVPDPPASLDSIGVARWQYDLWFLIISAALRGHPDQPDLDFHPALWRPAMSRYGATTPELLRWCAGYNSTRTYKSQVRPFGFLCGLQSRATKQRHIAAADGGSSESKKVKQWLPVSPFSREPDEVAAQAFDRETGEAIPREALQSYLQALAQYHLHPEAKFHGGDYNEIGPTCRRHLKATFVTHIGKEADRLEQQFYLGADADADVIYNADGNLEPAVIEAIRQAVGKFGQRRCAEVARMSLRDVSKILRAPEDVSRRSIEKLKFALIQVAAEDD